MPAFPFIIGAIFVGAASAGAHTSAALKEGEAREKGQRNAALIGLGASAMFATGIGIAIGNMLRA